MAPEPATGGDTGLVQGACAAQPRPVAQRTEFGSVRLASCSDRDIGRSRTAKRGQQLSDTLRVACENYRYALLTGVQLFDLVRSAKQDPGDDNLRALRQAIMTAEGPLPGGAAAADEAAEPVEAAAIATGGPQSSDGAPPEAAEAG